MSLLHHRQSATPHPNAPRPAFIDVLSGWTTAGAERFGGARPDVGDLLATQARADLLHVLDEELSFAAGPTMFELFQDWPRRRYFSNTSRVDYEAFVDEARHNGMSSQLAEVPALAPLLDVAIETWLHRICSLIDRLDSDSGMLARRFGVRGPVTRIQHLFGGSFVLTGADGRRVVYKGRPLGMDAAFARLLRWVNDQGAGSTLWVPEILDRGDYGWMSEVRRSEPMAGIERASYWERTGMLLCLAHAIGGGDLHAGNIQVRGANPVVLDAEVLLRPRRTKMVEPDGAESVLSTGWLPTSGHAEVCGLACERFDRPSTWLDPGTDAVRPRPLAPTAEQLRRALSQQLVGDRGTAAAIGITTGFDHMYRLVMQHGLPLELFERAQPRVLLRPTSDYVTALTDSIEPSALSTPGRRATLLADAMAAPPDALSAHPTTAARVRAVEIAALIRMEVPRFTLPAAGGDLRSEGRSLGAPFEETPMARAERLLARLSERDRCRQCRTIVASLQGAVDNLETVATADVASRRPMRRRPIGPMHVGKQSKQRKQIGATTGVSHEQEGI